MDDETKRKMIRKYFLPSSSWGIWLLVIGVLVLIGGAAASSPGAAFAGVILLVIGVLGMVMTSKGKPTDQQIDEWLEEDVEKMKKVALDRLGTEEEQKVREPLVLYRPIFWEIPGVAITQVLAKKGKDGLTRFSIWRIGIFHLTDQYLGAYHTFFNFLTGERVRESTEEFFYKDIVRVGTDQESVTLKDGTPVELESFVLKVASGDSIVVRDSNFSSKGKRKMNVAPPKTRMDETINAMRAMLREKKA